MWQNLNFLSFYFQANHNPFLNYYHLQNNFYLEQLKNISCYWLNTYFLYLLFFLLNLSQKHKKEDRSAQLNNRF